MAVKKKTADPACQAINERIDALTAEINYLRSLIPKAPEYRPWYTSFGVWLALLLGLITVTLVVGLWFIDQGKVIHIFSLVIRKNW